ncbi:unnamed protein product [Laminaria digitata]
MRTAILLLLFCNFATFGHPIQLARRRPPPLPAPIPHRSFHYVIYLEQLLRTSSLPAACYHSRPQHYPSRR